MLWLTNASRPWFHPRWVLLPGLLLIAAPPAGATVYKCRGENGTPVYQDAPCPKGQELRDFDKDPPTVSVLPLGPSPGTSTVRTSTPAPGVTSKGAAKAKKESPAGNAADRKFLRPGINEGEVVTRVGAPDMKSGGSNRKSMRWMYLPAPQDPHTLTTLTFEHGQLIEVERKIVK